MATHIECDHRLSRTSTDVHCKTTEIMIGVRSGLFASWRNSDANSIWFVLSFTRSDTSNSTLLGMLGPRTFKSLRPPVLVTTNCLPSVVGRLYRRCLYEGAFSNMHFSSVYVYAAVCPPLGAYTQHQQPNAGRVLAGHLQGSSSKRRFVVRLRQQKLQTPLRRRVRRLQ